MKKTSIAIVVAVCLVIAPTLLESQNPGPPSVACDSLQFNIDTVTYRAGNDGTTLRKAAPSDIICRKPIDSAAIQFVGDVPATPIPTIILIGQSGLVATLSPANVSKVKITTENGLGVAEVTFVYHTLDLAAGGAHVTVTR